MKPSHLKTPRTQAECTFECGYTSIASIGSDYTNISSFICGFAVAALIFSIWSLV